MTALTLLGQEVLAVRVYGGQQTVCMLPGPAIGQVCSLPLDHDGDKHAVEVLVMATITTFTSDLESPMRDPDPDDQQHAAEQRSQHTDRNQKPAGTRRPSPRDVLPRRKPEQR